MEGEGGKEGWVEGGEGMAGVGEEWKDMVDKLSFVKTCPNLTFRIRILTFLFQEKFFNSIPE